MPNNPVLVQAWRGDAVESMHAGALAIVDGDGKRVLALGDIDRPVFPRSAVKLLQALPLVASGAADALKLTDEELAIACASHNGEPEHTRVVATMLAKAGLDAAALECGAHWPALDSASRALAADGAAPGALHNNCSGKHAGFVCLGCLMSQQAGSDARAFVAGYLRPDHPVMREVTHALQAATGADLANAPMGIDGCSIPTFGIPLRHLALGFARAATGRDLSGDHAQAAQRLLSAAARAPFMVAGKNRFDTRVIERLGERVFCKVGAEGVYCAALPERGFGVAIKIDDGNNARAAEVVMAAVIEACVKLDENEATFMHGFSDVALNNWNGVSVGRLAASDALRSALAGWDR